MKSLFQQQCGADEDVVPVWYSDHTRCSHSPSPSSPVRQPEGTLCLAGELSQKPTLTTVIMSHQSAAVSRKYSAPQSEIFANSFIPKGLCSTKAPLIEIVIP